MLWQFMVVVLCFFFVRRLYAFLRTVCVQLKLHFQDISLVYAGTLSAVSSLQISTINSTISLNWVPPFTLDLFSTITYCVGVVNSTSSARLEISCGSDEIRFEYPLRQPSGRSCDDYIFTVTPVNEAGNGTPTSIQYSQALTRMHVSMQDFTK